MDATGLTTEGTKGRGKNTTTKTIWIASAFEVIGACRDPNGRYWGKWLRWRDADGRTHTRDVADAALQGDPSALCGGLADEGLSINRNQQRLFLTYLSGCDVEGRVTIVHRTGWHDIGGHQVFVLPTETIGPNESERVILDASAVGPYKARGTHLEALAADKDQLFAEAVHLFKAGASYAQEASWREDNRRVSNGDQVHMVSGLAMKPDQGYRR